MNRVVLELSVSLDGFAAGPDIGPDAPLGRDGERLHEWMFAGKSASDFARDASARLSDVGAFILGRRMADLGIGPWGEEPVFHAPCFVVTHRPAETIFRKGGTSYTFVTDGIPAALAGARKAAGSEDVMVSGGADVAQQFLNAGLVDEVRLHVVPVVLGSGSRLFDGVQPGTRLIPRAAQTEAAVTHLLYAAERAA